MVKKESTNPGYIQFPIFAPFPELICTFSTRTGGVSSGNYKSLNMGLHTGDKPHLVHQNRRQYFQHIGIDMARIAFPDQVHSPTVNSVSSAGIYPRCDALITANSNLFLAVQTADCLPVFIYDPRARVVALAHAGWQGAIGGVLPNLLNKLKREFNCSMKDLFIAIGPGLQKECFEVKANVFDLIPRHLHVPHPDPEKRYIDLRGFISEQLIAAKCLPEHLFLSDDCTKCDNQRWFSYRRDGKASGRMMGIIGYKNQL